MGYWWDPRKGKREKHHQMDNGGVLRSWEYPWNDRKIRSFDHLSIETHYWKRDPHFRKLRYGLICGLLVEEVVGYHQSQIQWACCCAIFGRGSRQYHVEWIWFACWWSTLVNLFLSPLIELCIFLALRSWSEWLKITICDCSIGHLRHLLELGMNHWMSRRRRKHLRTQMTSSVSLGCDTIRGVWRPRGEVWRTWKHMEAIYPQLMVATHGLLVRSCCDGC